MDDRLLAAVLDVLAEVEAGTIFGAAEVVRAVRPTLDPAPGLAEVDEVLALLALPILGGVVAVSDGTYRVGAAADVVLARLRSLSEAVRQVDDEDLADRY